MGWERVAAVAEMNARRGKTVIAGGRELALFLVDGVPFCLDNSCPHMDGPLAEGDVKGEVVYCPWHYWPINIRTGSVTYDAALCAATYRCRVDGDDIFVELE